MCPFDNSVINRSNNAFQLDSTDVLTNKITNFSRQLDLAEYYFIKMIAEFDLRKAWFEPGVNSLSYWLNLHCDICTCTAREKVRVARCLNLSFGSTFQIHKFGPVSGFNEKLYLLFMSALLIYLQARVLLPSGLCWHDHDRK